MSMTQAGKHVCIHVYMYACSCMVWCMLAYMSTWLLACNACTCLFPCMCAFVRMRRTISAPAKSYQSPVHATAHSDQDLYCSHKIYGSFCNLSRVTSKMYHRIHVLRRFRTICASAVNILALYCCGKISSLANISHKMSSLIISEKNNNIF